MALLSLLKKIHNKMPMLQTFLIILLYSLTILCLYMYMYVQDTLSYSS